MSADSTANRRRRRQRAPVVLPPQDMARDCAGSVHGAEFVGFFGHSLEIHIVVGKGTRGDL